MNEEHISESLSRSGSKHVVLYTTTNAIVLVVSNQFHGSDTRPVEMRLMYACVGGTSINVYTRNRQYVFSVQDAARQLQQKDRIGCIRYTCKRIPTLVLSRVWTYLEWFIYVCASIRAIWWPSGRFGANMQSKMLHQMQRIWLRKRKRKGMLRNKKNVK